MENTVRIQGVANGYSDNGNGSSTSVVLHRRIEFHPARKQFSGFGSKSNGDFRIETLNPDWGRKNLNMNPGQPGKNKKVDGSDSFENGLDPELSFGITFRRIGAGLENLGNTCFLNSVLQCLTYTEPLAAYLQSGKHQSSCHIAGFCALCAIQKHVSRALQSTGRSLVPKDLISNLRCISRNFRNARQEDAHEYMVNLLESMHKCCLPSGVPSESPAAYEKSLVHKIFGGRLCSQVECQQCFRCSNTVDPFIDLSLEIVKADTLPIALRNFTAAEMLDGGEKHYQCQQCKQKVKAKKRLTVDKAPYVLTIHLKRFHAHDPGRKVDKKVIFDRSLDMKPFVSGSYDGDLKYSLYGVLVHFGHSTHSGHYVCFVRTSSGMWYFLNDNEVRQVSEKTVLEQKAYMLFYVRDRKDIASRKAAVVVQKEKMKATVSSNISNLVFKDNGGNCPNENKSLAAVNQKGTLNVGIPKETILKEASLQRNNGLTMGECSVLKAIPVSGPSSSQPLLKAGASFQNPASRECFSHFKQVLKDNGRHFINENGSLAAVNQKATLTLETSKESLPKEASLEQNNGLTMHECSAAKMDAVSGPSSSALLPNTGASFQSPVSRECLPSSSPSVDSNFDTPKLEKADITAGAKTVDRNEASSSGNSLQNSAADKPVINVTLQMINPGLNVGVSSKILPGDSSDATLTKVPRLSQDVDSTDKALSKVDPVKLPNKRSCESNQGENIVNESAAGDSPGDQACYRGEEVEHGLIESSTPAATPNEPWEPSDCTAHKKSKKKTQKCRIPRVYVGLKFFKASLGIRKKKHRKSKKLALNAQYVAKEHFLDYNGFSSDLGPSACKKSFPQVSTNCPRVVAKSGSEKQVSARKCSGDSLMDIIGGELRERDNQNGAVLAKDGQLQKSSVAISEANLQDAREPDSAENSKRDVSQNGMMSIHARDLAVTTVAPWDGIELPPSEIVESKVDSIGYKLDEWDEEYDRGRRKKIRHSKHKFGGPNPFQEIASKKAQFKKPKMDCSSSGSQPFRI